MKQFWDDLGEGRQTKNRPIILQLDGVFFGDRSCQLFRSSCDVTDGLSYSRITLLMNAAQELRSLF